MGRRKRAEWVADTEATTDANDCRVWAWGAARVGNVESFVYGNSIDGLMAHMFDNPGRYWFHNLKYDVAFIFVWLAEHGYTYVSGKPSASNEYTAIVDGLGKVYSVTIGRGVELADSFKKIQMSVATVAKTYKLAYGKGEIDYNAYREPGHALTAEELDYLRRDVCIMAQAMAARLADGGRLTTARDCLDTYEDMCGGGKTFRRYFPVLNQIQDAFIRRAYYGGWVYVNPTIKGADVGAGGRIDVNSLYPWALSQCDMPIGAPHFFSGEPPCDGSYWVAEVTIAATLKPGKYPCIQTKAAFLSGSAEYGTEIDEQTFVVCSVDWELWCEMYDIDVISWGYGYSFERTGGLFSDYVTTFMNIKANSEGGERYQAKLFMNSLYGRFGLKTLAAGKYPVVDSDRILHYVKGETEEREGVYIPVAVFTCAHARAKTIRAACEFGNRFCYADTDSIHFTGDDVPDDVEIHPTKLGAWKLEARFTKARFIRPKTYAECEDTGHIEYKCAGMSSELKSIMNYDDFRQGFSTLPCAYEGHECDCPFHVKHGTCAGCYSNTDYWGLRPKNVPGGVILVPTPFSIK